MIDTGSSLAITYESVPQGVFEDLKALHQTINTQREVELWNGRFRSLIYDCLRRLSIVELVTTTEWVIQHKLPICIMSSPGGFSFQFFIWNRPDDRDDLTDDDFLLRLAPEHFPLKLFANLPSEPSPKEIDDAVFSYMECCFRNPLNLDLLQRFNLELPRGRESYTY